MYRILGIAIYGIFMIYIVFSIRYLKIKRKSKGSLFSFMTSFLILFTCTVIISPDFISNYAGNKSQMISRLDDKLLNESQDQWGLKGNSAENVEKYYYKGKSSPEGRITAYLDNATPGRGSVTNLIVTGPPKGKVTAVCHYKNHGTPYVMEIGSNGLAVIPIKVETDVEPGFSVVIDVTVEHNGKSFNTTAVLIPQ